MIQQLLADEQVAPGLFEWNGSISRDALERWIELSGLVVPEALIDVWERTGGGDMFESETRLRPLAGAGDPDGFDEINAFLRGRGMPDDYLVFHRGLFLSAVRQRDGAIESGLSSSRKKRGAEPAQKQQPRWQMLGNPYSWKGIGVVSLQDPAQPRV